MLQALAPGCEQSHRSDPVGLRHRSAIAAGWSESADRRRRAGRAGSSRKRAADGQCRRLRRGKHYSRRVSEERRTGIRIPREICRIRQQSLSEIVTAIARFADEAQGNAKVSAIDAIQAHVVLGQLHAYSGRMAEAIDQFAKARPRAARDFPDAVLQIEEMLGISYLHKSGLDNGVFRSPGDRCLLLPRMTPVAADTRFGEGDRVLHRHPRTPTAGLRGEVVAEPGVHDHRRLPRPGAPRSLDTRIDVRVAREHRALRRRGSGGRCDIRFRRPAA